MKVLLSLKHWQLLLLLVVCCVWTQPVAVRIVTNSLGLLLFMSWFYAIGIYGQKKIAQLGLPVNNTLLFRVNVLVVLLVTIVQLILKESNMQLIYPETRDAGIAYFLMQAGQFYLFFAAVYIVVFVSSTVGKLICRREVTLVDYWDNIIFILFFLIGIWFFQPRINRLIGTN
jgi:hypothetical protein